MVAILACGMFASCGKKETGDDDNGGGGDA